MTEADTRRRRPSIVFIARHVVTVVLLWIIKLCFRLAYRVAPTPQ